VDKGDGNLIFYKQDPKNASMILPFECTVREREAASAETAE
jgi:hypothetical protein